MATESEGEEAAANTERDAAAAAAVVAAAAADLAEGRQDNQLQKKQQ